MNYRWVEEKYKKIPTKKCSMQAEEKYKRVEDWGLKKISVWIN